MRDDLEQEEQLAAAKAFWKANRLWILSLGWAILISVAAYQGWNAWQAHQGEKASGLLSAVEQAVQEQKLEEAAALGKTLAESHTGTDQHVLAAFRIAKAFAAGSQFEEAAQWLRPATKARDMGLAWVARLRLSAVLIDLDQLPQALSSLDGTPPESFVSQVDDRRGDIHALMGQFDEASAAWNKALTALGGEPPKSALADIVARKIASLEAFKAQSVGKAQ
jgi:predicted negative regulator of RcsB-dependent stress response